MVSAFITCRGSSSIARPINSRKGERWFCTEQEALAAGWRRAYDKLKAARPMAADPIQFCERSPSRLLVRLARAAGDQG